MSDRSAPKPRPRLGPEFEPRDKQEAAALMVQLRQEARESGHLVVDLPKHVVEHDDGATTVCPFRWIHPAVHQLSELASTFIERAPTCER